MAAQLLWILLHADVRVQGLAAAADREQAGLIHSAIRRFVEFNPSLCGGLEFRQHAVVHPATGSLLEIISSDVQSSWGVLPDFVICDELCHWERPELWYSLYSSSAKRAQCVLAVLTNAGAGRGWAWQVREGARQSRAWHFSSLDGARAPWITDECLAEQRRLLPPAVFDRLWNNRWQDSTGGFVGVEEIEACRDEALLERARGEPGRVYFAAVDYAEKHDRTVGVVVHREGARIVVDRMDVRTPAPGRPVLVSWVEEWMREVAERFAPQAIVVDEYQLLGTVQRLEPEMPISRFEFAGGKGNHALALHLRKLIVHRELGWYPGCGADASASCRDDLETELASLVLEQSPSGRCRLDHLRDGVHHDDRAFALGAACLALVQYEGAGGADDWIVLTEPGPEQLAAWG
jgi:hypothetical protein